MSITPFMFYYCQGVKIVSFKVGFAPKPAVFELMAILRQVHQMTLNTKIHITVQLAVLS